jgi:hypothetical protein
VPAVLARRTVAAVFILFASLAPPRPAVASGGCIYIARFGPNLGDTSCSPTSGQLAGGVIKIISCDTGAAATTCNDGGAVGNGIPADYPGCFEAGQVTIGPIVVDACGKTPDDPPACKIGAKSGDLRRSSAGLVGDPVDLRTGMLSLDPLDVDLGRGLRFARHYSNASTVQSTRRKPADGHRPERPHHDLHV